MSYRSLTVALIAACVAFATHANAASTVKSSKSNSSDRAGETAPPSGSGAAKTTVKGSKSNADNRTGSTKGSANPAKAINLNSSKSN